MHQIQRNRLRFIIRILVILAALTVLVGWLLNTPPGIFGKVGAIGYAVCHQIEARSFHIGDQSFPLCARCSGLFLGALLGLSYQAIIGKQRSGTPPWRVILPLALMVLAFAVDGSNSYFTLIKEVSPGALANIPSLYTPNNAVRLLTGTGMGLCLAAALFPTYNQTVWANLDTRPALPGLKSFGWLVAMALGLDLLILTESPFVLYPLALIGPASVLLLLTLIYSIVWIILMRQENTITHIGQLWLPLLAGLTIALIQIAVIDWVRFWFTGTWGAFPIDLT